MTLNVFCVLWAEEIGRRWEWARMGMLTLSRLEPTPC